MSIGIICYENGIIYINKVDIARHIMFGSNTMSEKFLKGFGCSSDADKA